MTIAALGTTLVHVSACGGDGGDSEDTQTFRAESSPLESPEHDG